MPVQRIRLPDETLQTIQTLGDGLVLSNRNNVYFGDRILLCDSDETRGTYHRVTYDEREMDYPPVMTNVIKVEAAPLMTIWFRSK